MQYIVSMAPHLLFFLSFCSTTWMCFFSSGNDRSHKIFVTFSYSMTFVIFAIPLYRFFLRRQLRNNEIKRNVIHLKAKALGDYFVTPGKIAGFFYHYETSGVSGIIEGLLSIILIILCIILFLKKDMLLVKKKLILVSGLAYTLHFILVEKHIYAMLHPNVSKGYYTRYSYFYLPILVIVVPMIIHEFLKGKSESKKRGLSFLLGLIAIVCFSVSLRALLDNWVKAKDDQYTEIWYKNQGWKDITYLIGKAEYGFTYYVQHDMRYQEGYLSKATKDISLDDLPERSWVWRTNWDGEMWETIVDKAYQSGYKVTVFDDSGSIGQLALCTLNE